MSEQKTLKEIFDEGGVIAYPTEAMYGLGCDPDNPEALQKIIDLKGRESHKGFILIASDYSQLLPYINDRAIAQDKRFDVLSKWPGQVTWLIPKSERAHNLLTGQFETVAARVPNMESMRALCKKLGKPIVSTSANLSGQEPAKSANEVRSAFPEGIDYIVEGNIGGAKSASAIFDARTGEQLR